MFEQVARELIPDLAPPANIPLAGSLPAKMAERVQSRWPFFPVVGPQIL